MQPGIGMLALFSVLVPQKMWFPPDQPISVTIKAEGKVNLSITDFSGKPLAQANAAAGTVDLKQLFPAVAQPGTYLVFAGTPTDFAGTPLVIEVRIDKQQGPTPLVVKVEPLQYAEISTDAGKL